MHRKHFHLVASGASQRNDKQKTISSMGVAYVLFCYCPLLLLMMYGNTPSKIFFYSIQLVSDDLFGDFYQHWQSHYCG